VASSSRWSKTKDAVGKDKRYKAVPRDQREALFRAYTAELQVGCVLSGRLGVCVVDGRHAGLGACNCSSSGLSWGLLEAVWVGTSVMVTGIS
jgi:hypothetical protein